MVEYRESDDLNHIGGFLMTYRDESCITLSRQLSADDRARGREILLRQLTDTAVGTSGVRLWHPEDEIEAMDISRR
jgi:hypothetical protein